MTRVWCGLLLVALAPLLGGCGSSAPAAMTVTCTLRPLSSGLVEARTTVHNTTQLPRPAVVYGPALRGTHYVHPVLQTEEVAVRVGTSRQTFPGWVLPRVPNGKAATVVFRLTRPAAPSSILAHELRSVPRTAQSGLASTTYVISADNRDALKNANCTVK